MSLHLNPNQISRIISTVDSRNLPNSAAKGANLYKEEGVRHEVVVKAGVCSEGQLKRGVRAMNEHRAIGVAHRPSKLTHGDELELLVYCLEKSELDGHVKKTAILKQANIIWKKSERYDEEKPIMSKQWLNAWLDRQNLFIQDKPLYLAIDRTDNTTEGTLREWLALVRSVVDRYQIDSSLIFNFDESSLRISVDDRSLIVSTPNHPIAAIDSPHRIENATLCACVSSHGSRLDPVILWPTASIPMEFSDLSNHHIHVLCRKVGWINQETYNEIMQNFILPQIDTQRRSIHKSRSHALLIMDGHQTRHNQEIIDLADSLRIHILILPAHITHVTQPLDQFPFGVFKQKMQKSYTPPTTGGIREYRSALADVLPDAISSAFQKSLIMGSFRATGLVPLDLDVLLATRSKLVKKAYKAKDHLNSKNTTSQSQNQPTPLAEEPTASGYLLSPSLPNEQEKAPRQLKITDFANVRTKIPTPPTIQVATNITSVRRQCSEQSITDSETKIQLVFSPRKKRPYLLDDIDDHF